MTTPTPTLRALERAADAAAAEYERALIRHAFDQTEANAAAVKAANDALTAASVAYECEVTRANGWQPVL